MASFFGKLKSGNDAKGAQGGSTPSKKDPNAPQPTPLERMLQNAGPIRNDGSDKFFGLENFGNTCYCNSILQCLYYTPPFREHVLSYPQRATKESISLAASNAPPRVRSVQPNRPTAAPLTPGGQPKPEDKDSPEHKKKLALAAGPIVNMSYQNSASYDMEESIYSSLKDIFEAVVSHQNRHGVVTPTKFLEVLRKENEMFRSAMHQDAHEFFNLVLNSIIDTIEDREKKVIATKPEENHSESSMIKPDNSTVSWPSVLPLPVQSGTKWLRDMFEGTMTSETRCLTCETLSQRDEAFLDLSVDLEQHTSVTSCLNRFSEEEMLCERNKFHCDHCGGLQEAEKRMKIKKLPEVLALHLKRFKYTEDLQRLQKLHHKVVYPYHLRLFNTTDDADDPDRLYELYAVVVHIGGGPYHGHYVSIIKTQDRGWLLFDDEMVEPVDQSFVRNFFGERPGMASAYVLFYRHTTLDEVRKEQRMEGKRRHSQTLDEGVTIKPKDSAELHRILSVSPPLSPLDTGPWTNLDHATTAPQMPPNGHIEPPKALAQNTISPSSPTTQTKKDKAKADKAAEKEREKAEKARRKDLEQKMKDLQKKQSDDLRTAVDASKTVKTDEDQRNGTFESASKDPGIVNGNSSKDLFRRSKSFKFSSLGRKDKPILYEESSNGAVIEESPVEDKDTDRETKKKNRFSLRKKSFNLM